MIGKGRRLKSWKDVKVDDWVWIPWPGKEFGDIEHRLQQVSAKIGGHIQVRCESGALMEVVDCKECMKAVGLEVAR